jgi:Tfp pilus assembly protein PilO
MNRSLTATVLIIVAIGLYFTITKGVLAEANVIRDSNREYITAIQNAKDLIALRDKVLADYNKLTPEDREKLDKIVPQNVDNIRLVIDLNSVALRHGLALKGINASASASASPNSQNTQAGMGQINTPKHQLDIVTVSFGLSAPYQQFISFLQDLESSLRILDVSGISVTSNENGVYDWRIELKTYWLRNQ